MCIFLAQFGQATFKGLHSYVASGYCPEQCTSNIWAPLPHTNEHSMPETLHVHPRLKETVLSFYKIRGRSRI